MDPFEGTTEVKAEELVHLYSDHSYALAREIALIDKLLPPEQRLLNDEETSVPEIPRFANDFIALEYLSVRSPLSD